ncbi:hypothetical protein FH972_025572 [Carpinus fangiana]|uniref:Copper transport protein n=1 Tax=Carpinus fangiana TaxID=176857 RepID=A0A5N6L1T0_9ROSI|nr:hypothetical protein FH972_025572 [Carpinus fangiana]
MDHTMPGGHAGHDMPGSAPMCNMNMLFTWDSTNLCIVFRSWHIYTTAQLILSLLAIVALTAGYEAVRELSRRYECGSGGAVELGGEFLQFLSQVSRSPGGPHLRFLPLLPVGLERSDEHFAET